MLLWTDLETTGLDPSRDSILEVAAILTDDAFEERARFERVVFYHDAGRIIAHCRKLEQERAEMFGRLPPPRADEEPLSFDAWLEKATPLECWKIPGVDVDPFVVRMHWFNGLWERARRGEDRDVVAEDLRDFVRASSMEKRRKPSKTDPQVPSMDDDGSIHYGLEFVGPQLAGSTISFDREFLRSNFPLVVHEEKGVLHHRNVDVSTLNEVARRVWPEIHKARPGVGAPIAHRAMADIEMSILVLKHYLACLRPVDPAGTVAVRGTQEAA